MEQPVKAPLLTLKAPDQCAGTEEVGERPTVIFHFFKSSTVHWFVSSSSSQMFWL